MFNAPYMVYKTVCGAFMIVTDQPEVETSRLKW